MEDWLDEDHLARFVVEVIDQLDLSNLTRKYAGRGAKAHHPATLLAILVYGYATGVFSSRKRETATYDSVAFRYIAANTHPNRVGSTRTAGTGRAGRQCQHTRRHESARRAQAAQRST